MADCHDIHFLVQAATHGSFEGAATASSSTYSSHAAFAPFDSPGTSSGSCLSTSRLSCPKPHAICCKRRSTSYSAGICSCGDHAPCGSPVDEDGCRIMNGGSTSSTQVRVVQIFNPVLVKTDVANFRSLVQRLTGKSGCSLKYWNKLRRLSAGAMEAAALHVDSLDQYEDLYQSMGMITAAATAAPAAPMNSVENFAADEQAQLQRQLMVSGRRRPATNQLYAGGADDDESSAFSELDIHAALLSDGPLPDITMLPPLNLLVPPSTHPALCT